jgi:hypothetical protein
MTAIPDASRGQIEAILDRVERGLLSAGVVRPVRAKVITALEADIEQRAAAKSPDIHLGVNAADSADWRAYARTFMPRRSRAAWWGAACVASSLLPLVAVIVLMTVFSPAGWHFEAHFPHDAVDAHIRSDANALTTLDATGPNGLLHASVAGGSALHQFLSLLAPLSPLALAATLLGIVALVEIFTSRGKITGLAPALFATLFYPLLLTLTYFWLTVS